VVPRFRIVIGLRDRTAPSVFAALDRTFRVIGGAPTYVLTDNEKTVIVSHVASIAVSSNLHPAGFDELMPKALATATVDRLLHHAHVCQTNATEHPVGRSRGHEWAVFMATSGHFCWPPVGTNYWPLTQWPHCLGSDDRSDPDLPGHHCGEGATGRYLRLVPV
jgi:hypothetical protein